eukprot:TRINITY_DN14165_c0_g2_i1.p1 TRINITY_DN14165_c0_g2~~TRINITY_DN14165_c0_g2_i1.p1  ORF type:complete len:112 (+),score=5.18 TRINITY_DN14165_c0_g2_i1:302-637(+)
MVGMIHSNTTLKKLCLLFERTKVTDEGIIRIAQELSILSKLTSFTLAVNWTSVSDIGILPLIDTLSILKCLTVCDLFVGGCQGVTNKSAKKFAEFLRNNTNVLGVELDMRS